MSRFFTETLAELEPYVPGEQPRDMKYIKLNTNENPYPPTPWVKEVLNSDQADQLRLYSDPTCKPLVDAIATRYHIKPEQIMLGNGSDEVLAFAVRAFCDENTPLVFPDITYGCYPIWSNLFHIPAKIIPLEEDFTIDPTKYYECGGTIVLANPNAPTGIALTRNQMEDILKNNLNNIVIVDEAYVDFGAESCLSLLPYYDNLVVVQTFSKSHNLAGARIGYAMANEELIADLNRIKFSFHPYNINRLSMLVGATSMADTAYFRTCCKNIMETREFTRKGLEKLGFEVLPSQSNFLFARNPRLLGADLYKALKKRGILVRHFGKPRIAEYIRITIGTPVEMKTFLNITAELLLNTQGGPHADCYD